MPYATRDPMCAFQACQWCKQRSFCRTCNVEKDGRSPQISTRGIRESKTLFPTSALRGRGGGDLMFALHSPFLNNPEDLVSDKFCHLLSKIILGYITRLTKGRLQHTRHQFMATTLCFYNKDQSVNGARGTSRKIFQKSRRHIQILGARNVTWSKSHTEATQHLQ